MKISKIGRKEKTKILMKRKNTNVGKKGRKSK